MIRLEVGARPQKSPREAIAFADRVKQIIDMEAFGQIIVETADEIVYQWGQAQTAAVREQEWYTLQGLQRLLRQMQHAVEQGVRAAAEEGKPAPQQPTQTP